MTTTATRDREALRERAIAEARELFPNAREIVASFHGPSAMNEIYVYVFDATSGAHVYAWLEDT